MSIATRITSMEGHIEQAYDELQGLGADLTNVDKNIENISMVLDDLYNDLPKVTGSGTSITLDDTRKGRLESTLSGNTSQFTTTGKNFYSTSMLPITEYGITISKNDNGDIVLNGTPNFSEGYKTFYAGDVITVEAGTYTLSVANKIAGIGCVVGGFNGGCNLTLNDTVTSKSAYADTPQNVNPAINIRYDVGTLTNFVLNPQMEKSSSATTYEPFTNGASPNPDYPQEVNVVSGDNEIVVCGKNLFDKDKAEDNYYYDNSGNATTGAQYVFINISYLPTQDKITISFSNKTGSPYVRIVEYNSSGSFIKRTLVNSNSTTTLNSNTYKVIFCVDQSTTDYFTDLQIEYGSSATTYEAYQGNTYNIDLPVENLLQCNIVSTTTGGVTITNNNDESFTLQGTATVGIGRDIHGEITLKAGTYTFSADHLPTGVYISLANVSNTILNRATPSRTFTISTDTTYAKCLLWIDSGYTVNDTIKIQLEKGSEQNNFTPYGINPIELGVIGTYKDKFIRTSGKNLFDKNTITRGYRLDGSGIPNGSASNEFTSDFIEVESGKTYIRNYGSVSAYTRTCFYDKNKSFVSKNDDSQSITIPDNVKYIRFSEYLSRLDTMQLEKGTTATTYEPYGSREWYKYEAISQKILNGSENWGKSSKTQVNRYYVANIFVTLLNASSIDLISNYFVCITPNQSDSNNIGLAKYNENGLMVNFSLTDTNFDTLEKFKTWLTSNNVLVRYVLATPTYNKITYEPLLEQLEAYYHAKSRATQTNISQENNDLPFEISASALKEWSV